MRIVSIGGGPAGLYFAILMKKAFPEVQLEVWERNRPDDTFGFGVVFSDETLSGFEAADGESYRRITAGFRSWEEIETFYRGTRTVSTGHGFAAMERKQLLLILQERCRELGVELIFEREVESLEEAADADLVLGADGANSFVRAARAEVFQPSIDWRQCRFCWLGTDLPLDAFTFIFEETDDGLFQVHAYPYAEGQATWIVECQETVWRRAGLEDATEEETVAFCEELFAPYLDGHRLLANRSIWRRFPTVRCATWIDGNAVLVGDAAHTAHFSIGSGTKLAMEDAMQLAEAFRERGSDDVAGALAAYQEGRWVDILKFQKAAQTSLEWFENSARYLGQPPAQFTFNLMTRSKRITYDNLARRDPALVAEVDRWFAERAEAEHGAAPPADPAVVVASKAVVEAAAEAPAEVSNRAAPPPIFTPFRTGGLTLHNRIVVSPMCQYSARNGLVHDWHLVNLGSRAVGGAGLVITEMTDVLPEGRITLGCAGMYEPGHVAAWARIVEFVHRHSRARIGLQLAHAGRKGSARHPWEGDDTPLPRDEGGWTTIGPSAIPFGPGWPAPRAMDRADMDHVIEAFRVATHRAELAGFDLVELHLAHGYLLSSFISPLSNRREDEYGGTLDNRMRFPLEVVEAVRAEWPAERPLWARISASDWMPDGSGVTGEESVEVARLLAAAGCDLIDVSSAGNVPDSEPVYGRMYQVPFADRIRHEAGVPVAAVGALLGADHANTVLAAGRADLAVMARPHLRDPYLALHAAERYGLWDHPWPVQYLLAQPRPPK